MTRRLFLRISAAAAGFAALFRPAPFHTGGVVPRTGELAKVDITDRLRNVRAFTETYGDPTAGPSIVVSFEAVDFTLDNWTPRDA